MPERLDQPKDERSGSAVCSPAVKERPILFSGEMVRAILSGEKVQTRREMKPQPLAVEQAKYTTWTWPADADATKFAWAGKRPISDAVERHCPYGQRGERLWVRETCSFTVDDYPYCRKPSVVPHDAKVWYRASNDRPTWADTKWHPSIFMPRWASRITLEITGIRVERLHDITEGDARAEGVSKALNGKGILSNFEAFRMLWTRINGASSWTQNPWLWVVDFQMI